MELQRVPESKPVPKWTFTPTGIWPANEKAWEIQAGIDQLAHAA